MEINDAAQIFLSLISAQKCLMTFKAFHAGMHRSNTIKTFSLCEKRVIAASPQSLFEKI